MSASSGPADLPPKGRWSFKRRLFVAIMFGLLLGVGVYALQKTNEVRALKIALATAQYVCPADKYPGDAGSCGVEGPMCGHAIWSASKKCRVTELSTAPGCACYAGQVAPCLIADFREPCSGQSTACGVRYCMEDAGIYDYEDLCRPVGDAGDGGG